MPDKKIFLLIDAYAVIYRSFYSFPKHLTDDTGQLLNAFYGFSKIVLKNIRDFEPEYMAVTFDHKGETFRKKEYQGYKANRKPMPEELRPQIPLVKKLVNVLNIPQYCIEGYEADDLIGTISDKIEKIGNLKTVIISGDQDLFQLVDHNTHVWLPGRGSKSSDHEYDAEDVEGKIGVPPTKVIDLKALMGDSSDNIPGVTGIGPKTAVKLIKEYKTLDGVYKAVEKVAKKDPKELSKDKSNILRGALLRNLIKDKDNAYLSKELATIDSNVSLEFNLEDCLVSGYSKLEVVEFLEKYRFKSLLNLLPDDEFEKDVQGALF